MSTQLQCHWFTVEHSFQACFTAGSICTSGLSFILLCVLSFDVTEHLFYFFGNIFFSVYDGRVTTVEYMYR
jgi:hypothetical protein